MMKRDTLIGFFDTVASLNGEYLVYDDGFRPRSYSYRDVARAARNFAAKLEQAGIGKGDRVVLWSENRPEWVAAFWGCLLKGVAVAPIDERHSIEFLERVAKVTDAKLVFRGEEVELGEHWAGAPVWRLTDADWKSEGARFTPAEITARDTVQILFTSGATAEPKGVVITHQNILANIVPVEGEVIKNRKYARPFSPIRFLNLLPLSHMFGQAMAIFVPPMLAGTVIFQRSQSPLEIIRQIKTRRISVLVSVPKILEVLKEYLAGVAPETLEKAPAGERFWWRWWRYRRAHKLFGMKFWSFIVGGAALDPALESFFANLGFAVVQGYGLTEAAPIVTLNHPFHAQKGTVGKPIHGVEIRIADDGEVMVRGGNVTSGYFNNAEATGEAFEDGWFHTGDIGELDETGSLLIKGRKKEMIVLADGRNVYPEDVERVVNEIEGVKDSAAIAMKSEAGELVHAVMVLNNADAGAAEAVVRAANAKLEEHQKIRGYTVWAEAELPRTEGTRKLKRREISDRLSGVSQPAPESKDDAVAGLLGKWIAGRAVDASTSLDDLGLSSLDRVELLVALENKIGSPVDESIFAGARTIADLEALAKNPQTATPSEPFVFPAWSRSKWADWTRVINLNLWILNLARLFAWVRVEGRENLKDIDGPVIFASNHQGYFDGPILFIALPWKWRRKLAPAMRKEFFEAHFHPSKCPWYKVFTSRLNFYLAALAFNAVPIPQHEAGTRQTLRYIGEIVEEGWCPLIFPEGKHSLDETILPFQAGTAMMASKLGVPVVPLRIRGSNKVLHPTWRMARPAFVQVRIGKPMKLEGEDFAALARRIEEAVKEL